MAANFSFPLMRINELVQVQKDVFPELNITEADLKKPTTERWTQIYLFYLKYLLEVTHTMLMQPVAQLSQYCFEYPELHDNATFQYMLGLAMQRVMFMCEVEDFTYMDITQPTTKRCTFIMSGLVNFTNFFNGRRQVFDDMKNSSEEVIKDRQTKLERIEESKIKIEQIKQSRIRINEETKECQSQQEINVQEMSTKQQDSNECHKNFTELKKQCAAAEASNATLKEGIATKKSEIDKISRLIVQSPERKKQEMEHSSKQLAMLKTDHEQRQRRLVELTTEKNNKEAQQERSERIAKIFSQMQASTEMEKVGTTEMSKMTQNHNVIGEGIQDLDTCHMRLMRHLSAKQDKMHKMMLQAENKQRSMRETTSHIFSEHGKMQESQSEEVKLKQEKEDEISRLQQADKATAENYAKEMNSVKEDYLKMTQSMEEYNGRIKQGYKEMFLQMRHRKD